jgi:uncharacterized protein YjbI with pentapeptide repeats
LTGARLDAARMSEAVLEDADLAAAVLAGADLRGATADAGFWVGAKLSGARVDVEQAVRYALAHGLVLAAEEEPRS